MKDLIVLVVAVFYETLDKYKKVEKISYRVTDENKREVKISGEVGSANFKNFILASDELDPKEIEGAEIEIISPVLKEGRYKWKGLYKGEYIPFSMKSNEFKSIVQAGEVEFKNGTAINCLLTIRRKVDNEGNVIVAGYSVERVNFYYENEKSIETPEGKKYRQKKDADKQQMTLFEKKRDF